MNGKYFVAFCLFFSHMHVKKVKNKKDRNTPHSAWYYVLTITQPNRGGKKYIDIN